MYHESRTITPTQLVVAVESHAGHGEGAEVELSAESAAVSKAVAMDTRGKRCWKEWSLFCLTWRSFSPTTLTSRLCRGSDGKYHPGPAEIITKALVEGLAPEKFQQDVKLSLIHI